MVQFTKVRLTGFKSFVDPTELLIEPGLTGIVGPNGCGKSNLVEALRWIMGETSAKRMRGGEMDDVIFSGSATRPSRNIAEVSLILDNSDRGAPAPLSDYDEIDITRRIERGAGSTYRANGKELRARDVQLLFADIATGAHSPALVSQGRVGAIINAKPGDRRALLEEAAGIMGLHTRRHEAELRLRAAEANLERLEDVIATLDAQLQGLRRQARQANRYRRVVEQIRYTEAILLHLEADAALSELEQAQQRLTTSQSEVAEATARVAAYSTNQADAAACLPKLRQAEASATAALQRLLLRRETLDQEAVQAAAAKQQAEQRLQQIDGDRKRAEVLAQDAAAALARLDEERETLEAAAATEADAWREAVACHDIAAQEVSRQQAELDRQSERMAADEARAMELERRVADLGARLGRLRTRAAEAVEEHRTLVEARPDERECKSAEETLAAAERGLEEARDRADHAGREVSDFRAVEMAALERLQLATAACDRLEAEAAALASVLGPAQSDAWPPLLDAVAVQPGFESALGMALGDDLAASADEGAPVHWQTLPPYGIPPRLPSEAQPLSRFVQGPAALGRRLAHTGVVADSALAARLQEGLAPGYSLVTRDGALFRWDGYTAAAGSPTAAASRLQQRNRLAEVESELTAARHAADDAQSNYEAKHREAAEAASREQAARRAVGESFAAVSAAREYQARLASDAAAADSRLAALAGFAEQLKEDIAETEAALAATRQEQSALPDLVAVRAEAASLRENLSHRREHLAACQSTLDRLNRESAARARRLTLIAEEREVWSRRDSEALRHLSELDSRREAETRKLEMLTARPCEIVAQRDALGVEIETCEARRRQAADSLAEEENRLSAADRVLKAEEAVLAAAREKQVRAEAGLDQMRHDLEVLKRRIFERLECRLEQVLEVARLDPGQELPPREEVEAKLNRLSREREGIGPVNLRAEQEAAEVERRMADLETERRDLVGAIGRLRHGISSLNREGRERLLASFETVNKHFSELFVRLFGGGRAHLALTEAEDPLEAGLEIMASPPGKLLQVMSLLSGGEQALTALALLFAVFLTNPAPICVLDEVDAPLDDANVDRFCTLVEELAHHLSTRFLLITHHRMTMARVDRLFGVTMAERGVSQLVSVDLEVAESLRESA